MSEKIGAMRIFTKFGLDRLRWDLREFAPELLDWKQCEKANSIRWLLAHISMVLNVYIPRAVTGDLGYVPEGWPDDYADDGSHSLEGLVADIKEGEVRALESLGSLSRESLEDTLDWYIGEERREVYLMILASEILHHEGQVAAAIGLKRRMDGLSPKVEPPL